MSKARMEYIFFNLKRVNTSTTHGVIFYDDERLTERSNK